MMMMMMMLMTTKKRNAKKKKKAGLAEPLDKSRGEVDYTPRTSENGRLCRPILLAH
jgi:hypothetical protein